MNITREDVELAKEYLATLEKIKALETGEIPKPTTGVAPPRPVEPPPAPNRSRKAGPAPRREKWTLDADDIEPGILAWFDDNTLNTDHHMTKPARFDNVVNDLKTGRPFICIEADDDASAWVSLSRQREAGYLKLEPEWLQPRGALNGTSYVTGNVYRGPHESFCVAAAQAEFAYTGVRRPELSAKGLTTVQEFIELGGGR